MAEEVKPKDLTFQDLILYLVKQHLGGKIEMTIEELNDFFSKGFYYRFEPYEDKLIIEVVDKEDMEPTTDEPSA